MMTFGGVTASHRGLKCYKHGAKPLLLLVSSETVVSSHSENDESTCGTVAMTQPVTFQRKSRDSESLTL